MYMHVRTCMYLFSHVGNVVKNGLIFHEKVLPRRAPHVVARESWYSRERGEGGLQEGCWCVTVNG